MSRECIGSPQKKENEAKLNLQEAGENARNHPKTSLFPVPDRAHCGISTRKLHVRNVQPEKIRPDSGTDTLPVVACKRACPSATEGEPNSPNSLPSVRECHPFSKLGHWGLYDMRYSGRWQTD